MADNNKILAGIFNEMSAIYRYMGGEERFRSLAYSKAAKVIGALPEDVTAYMKNNSLRELPGIGEGIAGLIEEYVRTGKSTKYERLKKTVPHELLEMMEIKGFGPQSLKRIHNELRISTKGGLIKALRKGAIEKLKGFGARKVEGMLRGLKIHKTLEDRMLLGDALGAGQKILAGLKKLPGVTQAELCGSLRRKKETIGDIDLLVSCEEKQRAKIVAHFTSPAIAKQVLARGNTKASILLKEPGHVAGRQADLRIVNENEWGAALLYFTGSKEHNVHLRSIAKDKGYRISEYGIFRVKDEKKMAGSTEEEMYDTLGFQWIPPEMREDKGEITLAAKHRIPTLVSVADMKGDMQMHSVWSDGANTLEEIAKHIKKNYHYEYIVITDHSQSSRIANGMEEKQVLRQMKAIGQLNDKLGEDFVKKGIEVDILPDGTLDIADEILSKLDWVTASIHSHFNRDNTERIIRACQNPYVHCIGHPTGRLIGSREPYKVDMKKIVETAKRTHTALEINAQPERLDLNEEYAMLARTEGVKLVISTDAHSLPNFNFMELGVCVARRAWCTPSDVLNTMKWSDIEKIKAKKRAIKAHR